MSLLRGLSLTTDAETRKETRSASEEKQKKI